MPVCDEIFRTGREGSMRVIRYSCAREKSVYFAWVLTFLKEFMAERKFRSSFKDISARVYWE